MPAIVGLGDTLNCYRVFWKNGCSKEQGTMVLAAIEAVADAHTVGLPTRPEPNGLTKASTADLLHHHQSLPSFAFSASMR
ncbi:hypothetical protein EDF57_10992 [Novosphingobium sp. PhB55]|nr:hypothetical protein EDF57_10992 [Novosphingobium sp. PhB55]